MDEERMSASSVVGLLNRIRKDLSLVATELTSMGMRSDTE
jgi:hypothetical protein